ncbi:MAG: hypothetical protein R6W77_09915 [Trueperaceae bacterium]
MSGGDGRDAHGARDALFDLAVRRAAQYAARLGLLERRGADVDVVRLGLEPWYLKTRFAYRVPLEGVLAALAALPEGVDPERARWRGGANGGWSTEDG